LTSCSSHIRSLISFFSHHDVKLHLLAVSHGADEFLWVVLDDGGLVDEDVFLGVRTVDKPIAALHIEPFDNSRHLRRDDFFVTTSRRSLVLAVGGSGRPAVRPLKGPFVTTAAG